MPWRYEIRTGRLRSPEGNLVGAGYAGGNLGTVPEAVNNPAMVGVAETGPLPPGLYTFGTPVGHSHLGPFAIPLIPDPSNDMRGRGGFFMHGDKIGAPGTASKGCIIMPPDVRHACHASEDDQLLVEIGD